VALRCLLRGWVFDGRRNRGPRSSRGEFWPEAPALIHCGHRFFFSGHWDGWEFIQPAVARGALAAAAASQRDDQSGEEIGPEAA